MYPVFTSCPLFSLYDEIDHHDNMCIVLNSRFITHRFAVVCCYTYQVLSLAMRAMFTTHTAFPEPCESFHITPYFHWFVCCCLLQFSAVFTISPTLEELVTEKASFRHPHGWPDRNFPFLNVSSVADRFLSHACIIRRSYVYMMSQNRKITDWAKIWCR